MVNVTTIANFIKDSVQTLLNTENTCCRYELDSDWCIYVGWSDGFDGDNDYYYINNDGFGICCKIATAHEVVWADYDFCDMLVLLDNAIHNTDYQIAKGEDYAKIAKFLVDEYNLFENNPNRYGRGFVKFERTDKYSEILTCHVFSDPDYRNEVGSFTINEDDKNLIADKIEEEFA